MSVDGRTYRTSVTARPADLVAMAPATARLCGGSTVTLRRGENTVDVRSSAAFAPAGDWKLTVTARVSDFDEYRADVEVPIE